MNKQKLIVIVGPTASGKSALAVSLAKKFRGEVISADSRQIYQGLAIGSGAVTATETRGIPHHLLGVVSPRRTYTAANFVHDAGEAITGITRRGRLPIIAGGTAFWINALAYGMSLPEVPPDMPLRRRLEKKSAPALFAMLKKLDPRRAASIEPGNPRRLIRAIEIVRALGRVPPRVKHSMFDTVWLGINPFAGRKSEREWTRRVERRAEQMIRNGLAAETKKLLAYGVGQRRVEEFGFEYRIALSYLSGGISRREFRERLIRDTRRYARGQMRWWRRNPDIRWMRGGREAATAVRIFLQKSPLRGAATRPARTRGLAASRARPRRLLRRDS